MSNSNTFFFTSLIITMFFGIVSLFYVLKKNRKTIVLRNINKPLLIFDFDGVICDSFSDVIDIFNLLADQYNFNKINLEKLDLYRDLDTNELLKKLKINKLKVLRILPKVRKLIGQKIDTMMPFPFVHEFLNNLNQQGINLGIVTSNAKQNVHKFLIKNNLDHFQFILSSKTVFDKHRTLKSVIKNIDNISRDDVFYICDEPFDIKACYKANVKSIAVAWGYYNYKVLNKYNPNYLVKNHQEVLNIFTKINASNVK